MFTCVAILTGSPHLFTFYYSFREKERREGRKEGRKEEGREKTKPPCLKGRNASVICRKSTLHFKSIF